MARKETRSKWSIALVVFISFIMVSSILGFIYSGSGNTSQFTYNKIKFERANYGWSASINKQRFFFSYLPTDVENINMSAETASFLSGKPEIDSTSDMNDTFAEDIALAQYSMNIALASLNIYLRSGFTSNTTFNVPIIICEDSTYAVPVIYFKGANETRIFMQDNCIIAESRNGIDMLRIKDRILYFITGVIG